MAKIPDYTQFGETPNIRPSISIPSYGKSVSTGIAEEAAGIKEALAEIDKIQNRDDIIRAEDAYNELKSRIIDHKTGEQGYMNKKGKDVVTQDIVKDYNERFIKDETDITLGLSNERQKQLFRQRAEATFNTFRNDLIAHSVAEKKAYNDQVFKTTLINERNDAVANYANPAAVEASIARTKYAIDLSADENKLSPEAVKAMKLESISGIRTGVIDMYFNKEQQGAAANYYKSHKNDFTAKDRLHIEAKLKEGSSRNEALALVRKAMAVNDFDTGAKMIMDHPNAKVLESALGLYKTFYETTKNTEAIKLADQYRAESGDNYKEALLKAREIQDTRLRLKVESQLAHAEQQFHVAKSRDRENAQQTVIEHINTYGNAESLDSLTVRKAAEADPTFMRYAINKSQGIAPSEKEIAESKEKMNFYFSNPEKVHLLTQHEAAKIADNLDIADRQVFLGFHNKLRESYLKNQKEGNSVTRSYSTTLKMTADRMKQLGMVPYLKNESARSSTEKQFIGSVSKQVFEALGDKKLNPQEQMRIIDSVIYKNSKVSVDVPNSWTSPSTWFDKTVNLSDVKDQDVDNVRRIPAPEAESVVIKKQIKTYLSQRKVNVEVNQEHVNEIFFWTRYLDSRNWSEDKKRASMRMKLNQMFGIK